MSYDLFTYPRSPGFQRPDTSKAAAASMKPNASRLQAMVLDAISVCPSTADEVAARLGESVLTIRPRVTELGKLGRIIDTGSRRKNVSKRNAIVWRAI